MIRLTQQFSSSTAAPRSTQLRVILPDLLNRQHGHLNSCAIFAAASTAIALQQPSQSQELIRLPLSVAPQYETRCELTGEIIPTHYKPLFRSNLWTSDEHERFLRSLELFPNGPWKEVANVVGTKTTRQTMTHAQKYRQKIERRLRAKSSRRKSILPREELPAVTSKPFREVLYGALHGATSTSVDDATGTPMDPWNGAFDLSQLDDEFEQLIASSPPLKTDLDEAVWQEVVEWQL